MKVITRPIVLLSAVALLVLGIAGAYAQQRMMAEPTAVAVLDLQQLLQSLDERTEREADVARERERLQQEAEERRSRIQQIRNELDMLKAGTSQFPEEAGGAAESGHRAQRLDAVSAAAGQPRDRD